MSVFQSVVLITLCVLLGGVCCQTEDPLRNQGKGKHIVFASMPMHGHVNPMKPMAAELIRRGYKVSFILARDVKSWLDDVPGLNYIDGGTFEYAKMKKAFHEYSASCMTFETHPFQAGHKWTHDAIFSGTFTPANVQLFNSALPVLQKDKPDLFVVDLFTFSGFDLANKLDVPYVITFPGLLAFIEHYYSAGISPYAPRSTSGLPLDMTVKQRIINTIVPRLIANRMSSVVPKIVEARLGYGAKLIPDPYGDFRGRLMLVTSSFPLQVPRPLPPLVKFIGPCLPRKIKSLPPYYRKLLDQSRDGAYYLSMGTLVMLTKTQIDQFYHAFHRHLTLWSLPEDQQRLLPNLDNISPKLKIKKWLPQNDILAHRNLRVFVSHCGGNSAHESLMHGVPLLCIPFHADQFDFAHRIQEYGAGLVLDKFTLTAETIEKAAERIMHNVTFSLRARKLQKILKAAGGATLAADLIHSHLENGVEHLVSVEEHMPWWTTTTIDVFTLSLLLIILSLVSILSCLCCYICCLSDAAANELPTSHSKYE